MTQTNDILGATTAIISASKPYLCPCPFCGSADSAKVIDNVELGIHANTDFFGYTVQCSAAPSDGGCGAHSGFSMSPEEAAQRWNERAPRGSANGLPAPDVRELIEALHEASKILSGLAARREPLADELDGFAFMLRDELASRDNPRRSAPGQPALA